jgi:hypothetical protein
MHDYFTEVIDVADDEHCGFRVVSCLLDKSDEDHQIICLELTIKLNQNRARYLDMFGSQDRFEFIKNALTPAEIGPAPEDKWMMMPAMGFLLVIKYKHVVVLLVDNKGYSETFFPLKGEPTSKESLVCLG